jgi:hypothetical protein
MIRVYVFVFGIRWNMSRPVTFQLQQKTSIVGDMMMCAFYMHIEGPSFVTFALRSFSLGMILHAINNNEAYK